MFFYVIGVRYVERRDSVAERPADAFLNDGGKRWDLLTLGEPLICLTSKAGRLATAHALTKSIGGAESNVAIGLARLGLRTAFVSRVGSDPFGDEVLRTLRGEGVDTRHVARSDARPTGLMVKERRSAEEIHVYYYRHGSAASEISGRDIPVEAVASARRVHLSGITLSLGPGPRDAVFELLTVCRDHGVPVSFDPNFRLKLWTLEEAVEVTASVLPFVDDLLMSATEAFALAGATDLDGALEHFRQIRGLKSAVVKRGAEGVVAVSEQRRLALPACPVAVMDTVGAGDAFNAGYLYGLLRGLSFEAALRTGTWVASKVVGHLGDYEGLPSRHEHEVHVGQLDPVHR